MWGREEFDSDKGNASLKGSTKVKKQEFDKSGMKKLIQIAERQICSSDSHY